MLSKEREDSSKEDETIVNHFQNARIVILSRQFLGTNKEIK